MKHNIPTIIAEIGVNYYDIALQRGISPIEAAKLMATEAKKAGATVAKYQTYKADKLAATNSPAYWDTREEPTGSQRELFSKFDKLTAEDFKALAHHCEKIGIEFMSTPFDADSARLINSLVHRHKIASADVTNTELLSLIASFGKPVILSTGASSMEEVQQALDILSKGGSGPVTLLHCVLCYPTPPDKASLWKLELLQREFPDYPVGYSDHTKFDLTILGSCYILGAKVIEKHYTLDKNLKGNDHYHAADSEDVAALIKHFDFLNQVIGSANDSGYHPDEETARRCARRGVYLKRPVKAGQTIRPDDVILLRPQLDGLSPKDWDEMVATSGSYRQDLPTEQLLKATDIISRK